MDAALLATIDDIEVLRALVIEQQSTIAAQQSTIATRNESIRNRDIQIEALTFEIARLKRVQFSARSERMDPGQRALFDETIAADLAAVEAQLEALKAEQPPPDASRRERQVPKRRPLPPELPRQSSRPLRASNPRK